MYAAWRAPVSHVLRKSLYGSSCTDRVQWCRGVAGGTGHTAPVTTAVSYTATIVLKAVCSPGVGVVHPARCRCRWGRQWSKHDHLTLEGSPDLNLQGSPPPTSVYKHTNVPMYTQVYKNASSFKTIFKTKRKMSKFFFSFVSKLLSWWRPWKYLFFLQQHNLLVTLTYTPNKGLSAPPATLPSFPPSGMNSLSQTIFLLYRGSGKAHFIFSVYFNFLF